MHGAAVPPQQVVVRLKVDRPANDEGTPHVSQLSPGLMQQMRERDELLAPQRVGRQVADLVPAAHVDAAVRRYAQRADGGGLLGLDEAPGYAIVFQHAEAVAHVQQPVRCLHHVPVLPVPPVVFFRELLRKQIAGAGEHGAFLGNPRARQPHRQQDSPA